MFQRDSKFANFRKKMREYFFFCLFALSVVSAARVKGFMTCGDVDQMIFKQLPLSDQRSLMKRSCALNTVGYQITNSDQVLDMFKIATEKEILTFVPSLPQRLSNFTFNPILLVRFRDEGLKRPQLIFYVIHSSTKPH